MSDALDLFWSFLELSLERDRTPEIVTIKMVFPLSSALRRPVAVAKEPNDMSPGFFKPQGRTGGSRSLASCMHLFEGVGVARASAAMA